MFHFFRGRHFLNKLGRFKFGSPWVAFTVFNHFDQPRDLCYIMVCSPDPSASVLSKRWRKEGSDGVTQVLHQGQVHITCSSLTGSSTAPEDIVQVVEEGTRSGVRTANSMSSTTVEAVVPPWTPRLSAALKFSRRRVAIIENKALVNPTRASPKYCDDMLSIPDTTKRREKRSLCWSS